MTEPKQTITVRQVTTRLWKQLRMKAIADGKSVSDLINLGIQLVLNGKAK